MRTCVHTHTHTHTQHLPGPRKDMKTAEVAEESEGWFRLRTIPVTWSSDEEEGGRRGVPEDLRHKLKVIGRKGEGEGGKRERGGGREEREGEGGKIEREKEGRRRERGRVGGIEENEEGGRRGGWGVGMQEEEQHHVILTLIFSCAEEEGREGRQQLGQV